MHPSALPEPVPPFADFAQKYCLRLGVAREDFVDVMLARTLYPHARWLRPVLGTLNPNFFAADRDFLAGIGRLWRRRDFVIEEKDFRHNPANHGFLRRALRLRVSVRRTRSLVNALLADPAPAADIVFLQAPDVDAAPLA